MHSNNYVVDSPAIIKDITLGKQKISQKRNKSKRLIYSNLFAVIMFHILSLAAVIFYPSAANLFLAIALYWVAGSLGIGLGYHRLLTHRGFKAWRPLEYLLAIFGTLALQSGPIAWVTTHRIHHRFTDLDSDPHSPNNGFFWAHMGWIIRGTAQNHSDAVKNRYSPDLMKIGFYRVLDRYWIVPTVVLGIVLLLAGGPGALLWGLFFRTTFGWHATWLVNSAAHRWGSRTFETTDDSRNNPLVAAITFGEGWHNNHHYAPRSARHGLSALQIDLNWIQIKILEKLGLVSDVYVIEKKPGKLKESE
ncbi:MAG TPA: fatty acid desaturase [Pyrinomonadaceae bacterium]|nr:fatty acid desaturase [Pyrinomonadaceae bacterium]